MPAILDTINKDGTLSICATPQAGELTQTEFAALTYVEIDRIGSMPQFGDETELVSMNYYGKESTLHRKSFKTGIASEITMGQNLADAGQAILLTASNSPSYYAVKRVYTSGIVTYALVLVNGFTDSGGEGGVAETYTVPIQVTVQSPIVVQPA